MSWEDERGPASFRGLRFEATGFNKAGGKVLKVDHIPESDDHAVSELGAKPLGFSVQGYVEGDDYLDQIGNLEAAFVKSGAAELVLPWRGRFMVFIEDFRFSHDVSGGVGEFEIECVPAGVETRPSVTVITETDVLETGDAARVAATDELSRANDVILALPSYLRAVANVAVTREAEDLVALLSLASEDVATIANLVSAPAEVEAIFESVETLAALVRYLTRLGSNVPDAGDTDAGRSVADGVQVFVHTVRAYALARAAELALEEEYASTTAAAEMQSILVAAIDEDLALEPPDDVFTALTDLRASLISAMSEIASRLPRLRPLKVAAPTPALVLAFELYEDVEREEEILRLNGGGHPGVLVGELQVLSR